MIYIFRYILFLADVFPIVHAVPYTYVGCFTDIRNEWVFFWWAPGTMNANQCSDACNAQNFGYFGMAVSSVLVIVEIYAIMQFIY